MSECGVMLSEVMHLNRAGGNGRRDRAVEILRCAQNDTFMGETRMNETRMNQTRMNQTRMNQTRMNQTRMGRIRMGRISMRRPAFTLIELMVTIAIIISLLGITTLAFRSLRQDSMMADARNNIVSYAKIARSYAIANQIETMLVINPINGRFELWHLNPPESGGSWSPRSDGDATVDWPGIDAKDPWADGYAFAPVLDSAARLPTDGNGVPQVAVFPIDWMNRPDSANIESWEMDNLIWSAVCFDSDGRLVIRTRRIATRGYYAWNDADLSPDIDTPRPAGEANRLKDGSPDMSLLLPNPNNRGVPGVMVSGFGSSNPDVGDALITSTSGFVISNRSTMVDRLRPIRPVTPQNLKTEWLRYTSPSLPTDSPDDIAKNAVDFADTILLNRFSGQELAKGS